MHHYTLNSGHTLDSPRSGVRDDVVSLVAPLLAPGTHSLAGFGPDFADYVLTVPALDAGYIATVERWGRPILTLGVAATEQDEAAVWRDLERLYLWLSELPGLRSADWPAPHKPASLPWLAVVLVLPRPEWAGDFERCLAWAWLATRSSA